jgi:large subunit ribosomal protein L25
MAQQVSLRVETRMGTGKGAARALRRAGRIPGVIYGHNREPESVVLEAPAFRRTLSGLGSLSTIIDVTVGERAAVKALIREIQRDPIKPTDILHVDFYEVRADERITVAVPIHFTGTPEGVRLSGGVLDQVLHSLDVECLPADIPEHIEVDVTKLGVGQSIHVRDITVKNARILNDADLAVCSVMHSRTEDSATATAAPGAEPELIRKAKAEDAAE